MSSFLSRKKKPEKYELKSKGDDIVKDNYGSVTSLVNNEVRFVLACIIILYYCVWEGFI